MPGGPRQPDHWAMSLPRRKHPLPVGPVQQGLFAVSLRRMSCRPSRGPQAVLGTRLSGPCRRKLKNCNLAGQGRLGIRWTLTLTVLGICLHQGPMLLKVVPCQRLVA